MVHTVVWLQKLNKSDNSADNWIFGLVVWLGATANSLNSSKINFTSIIVHVYVIAWAYTSPVNPLTASLVTQGSMFLLRVLRGSTAPPAISPLTTRAGKKRKREEADKEVVRGEGVLNVELVNGWMGDALHDFITRKWVKGQSLVIIVRISCDVMCYFYCRNSNVPPSFFIAYIERYPVKKNKQVCSITRLIFLCWFRL